MELTDFIILCFYAFFLFIYLLVFAKFIHAYFLYTYTNKNKHTAITAALAITTQTIIKNHVILKMWSAEAEYTN
jgi:hypothetical protein